MSKITDRITPLPWAVKKIEKTNSDIAYFRAWAVSTEADCKQYGTLAYPIFRTFWDNENDKANAAYIVHACNTLPKLQALNAELVKMLEMALRFAKPNAPFTPKELQQVRDLIQKAKGVANG